MEIFLKDQYSTANPVLKNFEKVELFALISIDSGGFVTSKEELARLQITYLQAIDIMNDLLRMRTAGSRDAALDERPGKAFVETAFSKHSTQDVFFKKENKEGVLDFFSLVKTIKKQLSGANQMIKMYFRKKFLLKDIKV